MINQEGIWNIVLMKYMGVLLRVKEIKEKNENGIR